MTDVGYACREGRGVSVNYIIKIETERAMGVRRRGSRRERVYVGNGGWVFGSRVWDIERISSNRKFRVCLKGVGGVFNEGSRDVELQNGRSFVKGEGGENANDEKERPH